MPSSNLVKKISKVGEHFFGLETYLNNRDIEAIENSVSQGALTAITILGISTIISGLLYPDPWKYVFGAAAIGCPEVFRFTFKSEYFKHNQI